MIHTTITFIILYIILYIYSHDYGYGSSGVTAQLDKSKYNTLWRFPYYYYTNTYILSPTHISYNHSIQYVYIDTTTLAPSMNKCCNENGYVYIILCVHTIYIDTYVYT